MTAGLILAGGYGEKLWPMSKLDKPMQFHKIYSNRSMLRETFIRLNYFLSANNIFVVTNERYIDQIYNELPEINKENYIFEPSSKGTATAIALSSIILEKKYPGLSIIVCPSNNIITSLPAFKNDIENAIRIADHSYCLVTFGIKPTKTDTSYEYIKIGDRIYDENGYQAYEVKKFVIEPTYKDVINFIDNKDFLWNTKIFISKAQVFLEEISKFMPNLYSAMLEIESYSGKINESKVKNEIYSKLNNISIEAGIFQKTKNLLCIKPNFHWDTINSWTSLSKALSSDDQNNIHSGQVINIDTSNSIILGDKHTLIGAIGIKDIIAIKVGDALLLCNKDNDSRLKELIDKIKKDKSLDSFL